MKKHTYLSLLCLSAICMLLASCSSIKQSSAFSERKYYNFKHHEPIIALNKPFTKAEKSLSIASSPENVPITSAAKQVQSLKHADKPISLSNTLKNALRKTVRPKSLPVCTAINNPITSSSAPYTEEVSIYIPKAAEEMAPSATTGGNSSVDPVVLIVLAIFLSPLAVYLYDGKATARFWIDLLLWVLGIGLFALVIFIGLLWLFAVIYAILIVLGKV